VLQESQIHRHLGGRLRDPAQRIENHRVHLARVGLTGHRTGRGESETLTDHPVQGPDPIVVASEEFQERGLGSGRALASPGPQRGEAVEQLLHIEGEVLGPEGDPFAHRRELGRLKVGVRQAGEVRMGARLPGEAVEQGRGPREQKPEPVPQDHEVGVVGDEGARGAQVQVGSGAGSLVAQGVDMGHHVVAEPPLVLRGHREVGVVQVVPQIREGGVGDVKPQFALGLHQGEPDPAPEAGPVLCPPQGLHLGGGVPGGEGGLIPRGVAHRNSRSVKMNCPSRSNVIRKSCRRRIDSKIGPT